MINTSSVDNELTSLTEMMFEERSLLATHDSRVTKQRKTAAAKNAAIDTAVVDVPGEVAEQATVLLTERQVRFDRGIRAEVSCSAMRGKIRTAKGR
jgi:E3 ubiquitin-protein ligase SHPRH